MKVSSLNKLTVATIVALQLWGCTLSKENYTAGIIGCPAKEIKVTDESGGWNANSWDAECRGKFFNCTYATGGRVVCAESLPKAETRKD